MSLETALRDLRGDIGRVYTTAETQRVSAALDAEEDSSVAAVEAVFVLAEALRVREQRPRDALVHAARMIAALGAPLPPALRAAIPDTLLWLLPINSCRVRLFLALASCYLLCANASPDVDVSAHCARLGLLACRAENSRIVDVHFPYVSRSLPANARCRHVDRRACTAAAHRYRDAVAMALRVAIIRTKRRQVNTPPSLYTRDTTGRIEERGTRACVRAST